MKVTFLQFIYILFIIFSIGCSSKKEENDPIKSIAKNESKKKKIVERKINNPDCVEFVALWSAADIAEKIGKDKKWVFLNYTVDLLNMPPSEGEGEVLSKLRASSYAQIIEKRSNEYKVQSPADKAVGWISSEHVKTISWKNPKTKKLCK